MRRRKGNLPGNGSTSPRAITREKSRDQHKPAFDLPSNQTKFHFQGPRKTPRAMWKKYPTPFVWDNPEPEGDVILVTAGMYKEGTRDEN